MTTTEQHYTITDDRISPTPDVVTADELRDYLASMNESNDWDLDLDTLEVDETGASIVLDGEPVTVARPTSVITVNGHLVAAVPEGAIAYKYPDPIEDERWLYTDDEVQEIRREDPSLVVMVDQAGEDA